MIVTDLAGVTRAHGDRTIFADLSWSIEDRARIGLIGPNGSGKIDAPAHDRWPRAP